MQRKIGEIFEYNGEWYQCLNGECTNCDLFIRTGCSSPLNTACSKRVRKDKQNVIFKKLEKVGEPYSKYVFPRGYVFVQRYKLHILCDTNVSNGHCIYHWNEGLVDIEIKQNEEDMEEKNNIEQTLLEKLVFDFFNNRISDIEFKREVSELYEKHSTSEKIGKNLKEFNLEAAKAGKPVCTRDGRKARIVCFDLQSIEKTPIVAAVQVTDKQEVIANYYKNGRQFINGISDLDLMMLPEKKEGWVNIYWNGARKYCSTVHDDKKQALNNRGSDCIDTIKICWEE